MTAESFAPEVTFLSQNDSGIMSRQTNIRNFA